MAIAPNDTFTSGQILTAAECNAFPFGVVALASSTTDFTLGTTVAISTGMTVTFTAIANRYYKVTYVESQAQLPQVAAGTTNQAIKLTNATGTVLQVTGRVNPGTNSATANMTATYIGTMTAGSVTIVGTGSVSATTGTPVFGRSSIYPAFLLVEDIGPA